MKSAMNYESASMAAYEREIRRRLWRRRVRVIAELVESLLIIAAIWVAAWLWCAATPEQASAECELAAKEMEAAK